MADERLVDGSESIYSQISQRGAGPRSSARISTFGRHAPANGGRRRRASQLGENLNRVQLKQDGTHS